MYFPTDRIAHTTAINGLVIGHGLECKIIPTANATAEQDRLVDPKLYRWVLCCLSYVLLPGSYAVHCGLVGFSSSTSWQHLKSSQDKD